MTDQPNTDDPTIARPFTLDQLRDLLDVLREAHHRRAEIIARTRTALDYAKGYSIGVVVNLEQKADPIAWPSAGVPADTIIVLDPDWRSIACDPHATIKLEPADTFSRTEIADALGIRTPEAFRIIGGI